MTNAEIFIEDFVAVETILRKHYGSKSHHEPFLALINSAEKKSNLVKHFAVDLREFAELRNAIIHNRTPNDNKIIAEPHSFVVEAMSLIRKNFENPVKVKDIMVKSVFTATTEKNLTDTAKLMFKKIYTHVPVYKEDNFIGVLSESAILKWVGELSDSGRSLNPDRTISDMEHQLDQPGNKFNDYEFANKNMGVLDIKNRFERAMSEGRRLGAIFITKTGKKTEKIEGIVTAWDIPKMIIN